MSKRFQDKVVVITGGAGVIGSTTAKMFLQEGAKVVLSDISKQAKSYVGEWQQEGFDCTYVPADVTNYQQVEALIQSAVEAYGRIDILFTSAGLHSDSPCHELEPEVWDRMLAVNLSGTFYANKFAIRQMLKQGGGVIVNSGSIYSILGRADLTAYSAAMGAIRTMSRSVAVTYADKNIRVNTVCPGTIDSAAARELTGKTKDELIAEHPVGRLGTPEEVGKCVLFLASEKASFVSGAELVVDGGYKTK